MTTAISSALGMIPEGLRTPLLKAYNEIQTNFRERRWEPSELNGGKLCEIVYTIISGYIAGAFPPKPAKPSNMVSACQALEQTSASVTSRSVRIQIPRILVALYEIRNNRNVGHVGGDVDPNEMDAVAVLYMSRWIMAELVRIFHNVDTEAAQKIVESLAERISPTLWQVDGKTRVLNTALSMKEKTLLLLYCSQRPLDETALVDWLEHSNPSIYRRDVLRKMHSARLIEYNNQTGQVTISPTGIHHVESELSEEL